MKKILCLVFIAVILASCATIREYKKLVWYVNENDAAALSDLIDNTKPAKIKLAINTQDFAGRTLLHKAVLLESPEIVEKLLSADADKTVKDSSKYTAADYAESARNEKIRFLFGFFKEKPVEAQKERPVKPQAAGVKKMAEAQIIKPEKPLEIPRNKPEKRIALPNKKAEKLQDSDQTVTVAQDTYSYNVILGVPDSEFLKAVRNQDYRAVNGLLKNGKNVNETDINGNNALFYAMANGNNALLNLLLSYGINPNYANVHGQTPLLYAVHKNDRTSITAILDAGANINQKDVSGISAVMIAVFHHDAALLRFLNAKGAYLTGEDAFGNTLLHIAIKNEDVAIVRYLLENGCDMYAPGVNGITPLELLKKSKRTEFQNIAENYE